MQEKLKKYHTQSKK